MDSLLNMACVQSPVLFDDEYSCTETTGSDSDYAVSHTGSSDLQSLGSLISKISKPLNVFEGVLYAQRLKSFILGGWPIVSIGRLEKCTPHELAMSGLEYCGVAKARCVFCQRTVTGLSWNIDPWEAHKSTSSKCVLVLAGKPNKPDGYSMEMFINLVQEKRLNTLEYNLQLLEEDFKEKIKVLAREENNIVRKN